jgi:hypothetical protein
MRLVDIHLDADRRLDLQFRGRLTVVVADDVARDRLAGVLANAFVLAGTELTGTVDAGDYLTPLDPTAVVALDLPGDGLPVLGPGRLPEVDHGELRRRRAEVEARRDALVAESERAAAATAAGRRRVDLAGTAVTVGRAELDDAERRVEEAAADLDAATARIDELPGALEAARAAVDRAELRLRELQDLARVLGEVPRIGVVPDHAALGELLPRCGELAAAPEEVLAAVASWCAAVATGAAEVHDRAAALADEVAEVDRAWAELSARGVEGDDEVVAAVAALADAGAHLADLQALADEGVLGERVRREVEDAHEALVALRGRHGRDGGTLAAAEATEAEALARYGFDSYLDFTIAVSTRSAREVAEERLAAAAAAAAAAEAALEAARAAAAARRDHLAAVREAHLGAVVELLGHRPEGSIVDALRTVPGVPSDVADLAATVAATVVGAEADLTDARASVDGIRAELDDVPDGRDRAAGRLAEAVERRDAVEELVVRAGIALAAERSGLGDHEADEAELVAELASVDEERRRLELAADGLGAEELRLLGAAVEELVATHARGVLPVVLHDLLAPLGPDAAVAVLGRLAVADGGQLLYLTADRCLADWARSADGVGLVELRRPGWLRRHVPRRAHAG